MEEARELLEDGARRGAATAPLVQVLLPRPAHTAPPPDREDLERALAAAHMAASRLERALVADYPVMATFFAASALANSRAGPDRGGSRPTRNTLGLCSTTSWPSRTGMRRRPGYSLAAACLHLDDSATAEGAARSGGGLRRPCPRLPRPSRRWLSSTRDRASSASAEQGHDELTPAELRTLQFLPSHLSFREIAERSFVSPNTVKTQAQAIYRKLDASSRAEAVDQAREAGLLRDEASTPVGRWPAA